MRNTSIVNWDCECAGECNEPFSQVGEYECVCVWRFPEIKSSKSNRKPKTKSQTPNTKLTPADGQTDAHRCQQKLNEMPAQCVGRGQKGRTGLGLGLGGWVAQAPERAINMANDDKRKFRNDWVTLSTRRHWTEAAVEADAEALAQHLAAPATAVDGAATIDTNRDSACSCRHRYGK